MRLFIVATIFMAVFLTVSGFNEFTPANSPDTLTLPSIINNHMVIQQQSEVALWGWDRPGTTISVDFRESKRATQAGLDGKWLLRIPSGRAGGAFPLTIQGTQKIILEDVLVGEVWVAGGQSNMWWPVKNTSSAKQTVLNGNYREIRLWDANTSVASDGWRADTPQNTVPAEWKLTTPQTVGDFSGTAYFFARELYETLKVPIGIIHLAVPGREIEAFLSSEFITANLPQVNELELSLAKLPDAKKPLYKASDLFNGMVYPAAPFSARGFIWWQGESNAGRSLQYSVLFPSLIKEWRHLWQQEDAPFLFVELANFLQTQKYPVEDDSWPALRDAQKEALRLPHTAMISTIDIVAPGEDMTIHPANKQLSGHRLFLAALALVYGQSDLIWSGPTFGSVEFQGNQAIVTFEHIGEKLVTKDGLALRGFALAGRDQRFFWASGTISGNKVILTSKAVEKPVAVRYGWANNPLGNLNNSAGLPALTFRSDTWLLGVKALPLQQMNWQTLATFIEQELPFQQSEQQALWEQAYLNLSQQKLIQALSLVEQLLKRPIEEEILAKALNLLSDKLKE